MPYQHIKSRIPRELDRRVKITNNHKAYILGEYFLTEKSQRQISRETGISRRMISFILFPERLKKASEQYKERRKDGRYYKKEKHTQQMKSYRRYKQKLFLQNKLCKNTN